MYKTKLYGTQLSTILKGQHMDYIFKQNVLILLEECNDINYEKLSAAEAEALEALKNALNNFCRVNYLSHE